jgi:hypothetical protein
LTNVITYEYRRSSFRYHAFRWWIGVALLLLIGLSPCYTYGQASTSYIPAGFNYSFADTGLETRNDDEYYDEISVTLNIPRIGSLEIPAIIYKEQLYLPIKDLFDFLKIRNIVSPDFDLIEGFFIDLKNNYVIDKTNNRIVYGFKSFALDPRDMIRTETNLFLKSDYFWQIFGLDCVFDFRSLSVTLNTKIELPVIREMQMELMRRNISRLKGEKKADTIIGRGFPVFNLGMIDWGITSSQETKGRSDTRINLGIGAMVAGGEMNLSMNYYSRESIQLRQQSYQWRFVNNEHTALRQVTLGKIIPQSTASVFAPLIGMQLTNTPSTYRRSFGTFTLSNTTEPGWTVELYINNILVNYTKADASGFFTFEVPMVYGNSIVKLRFYGPWGEEKMSEKYITVPFNFIPLGQLEYTVSAGIIEDKDKARFARATVNYGLARRLTVGGGMEYLSSLTSGKIMPFMHASLVVSSRLLVSAEHNHAVNSKLAVNYRLPSNLQFDITYIKYVKGQTAIRLNQLDEKKLVISMPLRGRKFNSFSRLTLSQFTFPFNDITPSKANIKYSSAEYLFSSVIGGISSNLTTNAMFTDQKNTLLYSNLSLTFRLPAGIRLSPQVRYDYKQGKPTMIKAEVEKNLFSRGFLNLSYEKDLINGKNSLVTLGLRFNFSFAQTFFSASRSGKSTTTNQSARGSLMVDSKTNYLGTSNQTQTGKGGIVVLPYLDMNCNGKRDAGEPKAFGLKLHINGGRIEHNAGDTIIRISGLEAYASYYLELDKASFDNIGWQLQKHTLKVVIDPNRFKLIEIPVAVVGEVSGTVFFKENNELKGLSRVIVNIYNRESGLVAKVLTESDGFFSFVGLGPGEYTASVDAVQLAKLNMVSSPAVSFEIEQNREGDIVNNLRFVLHADKKL